MHVRDGVGVLDSDSRLNENGMHERFCGADARIGLDGIFRSGTADLNDLAITGLHDGVGGTIDEFTLNVGHELVLWLICGRGDFP